MGKTDTTPPASEIRAEDKGNGVRLVKLEPAHLSDKEWPKARQAMLDAVPETNLKFSDAGKPPHLIIDLSALKELGSTDPALTRLGSALIDVSGKMRRSHMSRGQLSIAGGNDTINGMIAATGLGILMNVAPDVEKAITPASVVNRAG